MAKRLVAKVGEYTNKQGETKGEYVRIGIILENQNGEYALIDPAVDLAGVLLKQRLYASETGKKSGSSVMCSVFTGEPQSGANNTRSGPAMTDSDGSDFSDNIPF